jgi:hypothetical protein
MAGMRAWGESPWLHTALQARPCQGLASAGGVGARVLGRVSPARHRTAPYRNRTAPPPTPRRYNTSGTVNLRFEADYGGVLRLDKAEAVVEYEVMEEKIVVDEGGC